MKNKLTPLHQTLIHMTPTPLQQTLCNGLLCGLKVQYPLSIEDAEGSSDDLRIKEMYPAMLYHWKVLKPVLFPLDMLDKEIEINGERFVPYVLLMDEERKRQGYVDIEFKEMLVSLSRYPGLDSVEFWIIKRLLSWHFNIEQLPPDQFMPVTETFNPYK